MKNLKKFLGSLAVCICLMAAAWVPQARAAQDSTVIKDNAPIHSDPTASSKVLEYLPMGSEVRISSYPMPGGWYKIRSDMGAYGWINQKYLSVYIPPTNPKAPPGLQGYHPARDRKWFVRVLGGFDFFRPADLNAIYNFSDLDTGYTVGGEFGRFLSKRVALVFRGEGLFKDLVAKEQNSGIFVNLAVRAYPAMAGFDFYPVKLPALRLSIGIFGGIALATSFSNEAPNLPLPNVMVIQRSPFTSLARVNLSRPLGRILSVFLELGYRYLRTESIDTTAASGVHGGPQIFNKDGVYRSRVIDLSGVELAAGLAVHF